MFYEFLVSFYDVHEDEDSYFWSARKVTDSASSDLESFVSLVGGVSSGETALTDRYKTGQASSPAQWTSSSRTKSRAWYR